ncbi:hypothetical protein [Xanthobacter sp. KR7-225]|uniref:hypothetical protein n=1 Tax=Xanthobacter sp. KR7-225 TaxID=3156613 RepID=UPI0032B4435F
MPAAARVLFRVPVVGWFLKDAVCGLPDAKYYFIANLGFLFAGLTYRFGYAFLIVYGLTATALAMGALIVLTASDLIANWSKKR